MPILGPLLSTDLLDVGDGSGEQPFGAIPSDTIVDVGAGPVTFGSLLTNVDYTFVGAGGDLFPLDASGVAAVGMPNIVGAPSAIFRFDMATNADLIERLTSATFSKHGSNAATSITSTDFSPELAISQAEVNNGSQAVGWQVSDNSFLEVLEENFAILWVMRTGALVRTASIIRKRISARGWNTRITQDGRAGIIINDGTGTQILETAGGGSHENTDIVMLTGRNATTLKMLTQIEQVEAALTRPGSLTIANNVLVSGNGTFACGPFESVYGVMWIGDTAVPDFDESDLNAWLTHFGMPTV